MPIRRHSPRLLALGALAVMGLTLSACSGGEPASQKTTAASGGASPSAQATTSTNVTSNRTLSDRDSPLSKLLGSEFDSAEPTPEELEESKKRETEYEAKLATCMKDEGFDYFPVAWTPPPSTEEVYANPDQDDIEYIKQVGFAIASQADVSDVQVEEDKNLLYMRTLSESALAAYNTAKEGVYANIPKDDPLAEAPWDWRKAGCTGKVTTELFPQYEDSEFRSYPTEEFQPLIEEAYALSDTADASAEQKRLDEKWQDCMATAGYSYATDYDAYTKLYDEFIALGRPDPENQNGYLWDVGSAEFQAFREKEIDTAVAAYDCREKLHYADEKLKIRFALEEKFIADHRAEFDAYKKAAELEQIQIAEEAKEWEEKQKSSSPSETPGS